MLAIRSNDALRAIVERAAALLDTPIAALTIIDRERQWCPVAIGLPGELPRQVAFCSYAVRKPGETLCVLDATADTRFSANPLVTPEDGVRFYLGAPLVDEDGLALGAICVLDRTPRESLSDEKRAALQELAREAMVAIRASEIRTEFAPEAVEHIVSQMRDAAKRDDETLLLALDRVVQMLEQELTVPLPHDWLDEPIAPADPPRQD
ncbi:GAF domain-containing protein [Sphingomonas sp. ac-8]|uniref:GAF domain-containing protein n=1 Tax=Sphingomonas sp. ac-8 TaxID=3242977 RepID=UPI003A7FF32C